MEREQFILFIEPVREDMPNGPTEDEARIVGEHFGYLKSQLAARNLILAGRTTEPPFVGIAIFEAANPADAEEFVAKNPAIVAGVFRVKSMQSYRVALIADGKP